MQAQVVPEGATLGPGQRVGAFDERGVRAGQQFTGALRITG